jgi:hypothetical protein
VDEGESQAARDQKTTNINTEESVATTKSSVREEDGAH